MLDDVERRRLLVEPPRKDPVEGAFGIGDVELDEGAGQLLDFPRRRRLAGAQPHDDVADPLRLAGLQRQVALDAVALVEQADHGDALRHRRGAGRLARNRLGDVDGLRLGRGLGVLLPLGRAFRVAGGERGQRRERQRHARGVHASSGVQAS